MRKTKNLIILGLKIRIISLNLGIKNVYNLYI